MLWNEREAKILFFCGCFKVEPAGNGVLKVQSLTKVAATVQLNRKATDWRKARKLRVTHYLVQPSRLNG